METAKRVLWQNSEYPDEMQHYTAFNQGLHCLLTLKQPSGAEIHHSLGISTCDPLKDTMGSSILIVSIFSNSNEKIHQNTKG